MLHLLHHSHCVFESTLILGLFRNSHRSFQENLDRGLGHVVVDIERLAVFLAHTFYDRARIRVKKVDETLEDVQMERRGDQFTMCTPCRSCKRYRSINSSPFYVGVKAKGGLFAFFTLNGDKLFQRETNRTTVSSFDQLAP